MRPELEQIETIEKYLNGQLSAAERIAFESQLAADPALREAVALQQDIQDALHRISLTAAIKHAKHRLLRNTWLRRGGFGLGAIIIAITALLVLTPPRSGPASIPGEVYTIDLTRDTLLTTIHGARIQIPSGSIDAEGAHSIRLNIREAYTIADMIRYSLTTQSYGQPLGSGGMIDIQPAPGTTARIVRPLTIKLPTSRIEENMQLFKGATNDNGKINWTDPKPLPDGSESINSADSSARKDLAYGRNLFQTNCAQCHSPSRAVTGPPLAYIGQRRSFNWLVRYIRNNQKVLASGDCYSQYIFNAYNKTLMPLYPNLSDKDIDCILHYLQNQSPLVDSNSVPDPKREFDSCRQYRQMADILNRNRQGLIDSNGIRTKVIRRDDTGAIITDTTIVYTTPAPVITVEHPSIYYQFTIESFGWYNVDALLKDLPGIEPSELRVHITEDYAAEVNAFLVIPGRKVLTEGGYLKDSKTDFGFLTEDAQIPLPQNEQAYVFATGEYHGKPVFSISPFIID